MVKKIMLILLMAFGHLSLFAQETDTMKRIDFIINIDDQIIKSIYQPKIVVSDVGMKIKSIPISYHPGDLSLDTSDFAYLLSLDKSVRLSLKFEYYQYTHQGEQNVLNYDIEIDKN